MKKIFLFLVTITMAMGMTAQPPHHHESERGRGHGHGHAYERRIVCATPEQISMTMHVLRQQSFDDKKLEIAKLAVTLGRFCTNDLAHMASLFSFDESRLDFLLYAHAYCEDAQNYPMLRDVFTFQSNYDEMIRTLYPRR